MKQLFPKNEIKSRLQPAKAVIATDAEITVKVLNTVMKPQSNNLKKKKGRNFIKSKKTAEERVLYCLNYKLFFLVCIWVFVFLVKFFDNYINTIAFFGFGS